MAAVPVFSSLSKVVVPSHVPAGAKFEVRLSCSRNGEPASKLKSLWRAAGNKPVVQRRTVTSAPGKRWSQRPSERVGPGALAVDALVTTATSVQSWETEDELPFECHQEDVGWRAGPVGGSSGRKLPDFTGPKPGPTSARLTARSGSRAVMRSVQFTPRYKQSVIRLARQHAYAWQRSHSTRDKIEKAFSAAKLVEDHVELWLAIRARIAMTNPHVPASWLWSRQRKHLYDPWLDAACPFDVYQWLNRHLP